MGSFALYNADEEDCHIPAIKHYHPGVCGTCYVSPSEKSPLLRCSQCQLISYCSKACQKTDWLFHRTLCLVNKSNKGNNIFSTIKKILLTENVETADVHWYELRCDLALTCSINLKRPLCTREREMFLFPRVCEVCKDSSSSILTGCKTCHSVFYCSDEHRETDKISHSSWCSNYLLCLQCDSVEAKHGMQDLPFPTIVDEVYVPLEDNLMTVLNSQLPVDPSKTLDHRFVTMIGERLSFPFSLLYAMEKLDKELKNDSLKNKTSLKIHVIGAESSVELLGIIRWEYLLHRLPTVLRLHIAFVGPNVLKISDDMEEIHIENHCVDDSGLTRCPSCVEKSRVIVYEMAAMLYHEFSASSHYSDPDVIVSFNCGFHEYADDPQDTWSESLQFITKSEVPLIFTSYTELEAKKDLKVFTSKNHNAVEIKLESHLNPFCSPRPFRDPARDNKKQIYFHNQYLTCVTGSSRHFNSN